MSSRRTFLHALGISCAAAPLAVPWPAKAQLPPKPPRVGVIWFGGAKDPFASRYIGLLRQRLRELGYTEGKSILIDEYYAEGDPQRLNELARELVAAKVDIIVATSLAPAVAARQATTTIPIVMLHAGDPIGAGLIVSLARPGGNVTGTMNLPLGGKVVELMHEILPRMRKLAVLTNPTNVGQRTALAITADAARSFGIDLMVAEVSRDEDFPSAYAKIRQARADGLLVFVEPLIGKHRPEFLEFAARDRLPVGTDNGQTAKSGGLVSYGPLFSEHYLLGAVYVDKILKGAKPADLPIAQPARFEMIINMKTARALGLKIPQSVLLRADEVIE